MASARPTTGPKNAGVPIPAINTHQTVIPKAVMSTNPLTSTFTPLGFNVTDENDSNYDPDEQEMSSEIHLTINTPLLITGDNNVIAVDPSNTAKSIAGAVVAALKQMSMGGSGVPMIDENGRPRPIKIAVQAETRVEGSKNVVGERAIMGAVVKSGAAEKVREMENGVVSGKRQRVQDENEAVDLKRTRVE